MSSKTDKPTKEEVDSMVAWLVSHGMDENEAKQIVKQSSTREKISEDLRKLLKDKPKKVKND